MNTLATALEPSSPGLSRRSRRLRLLTALAVLLGVSTAVAISIGAVPISLMGVFFFDTPEAAFERTVLTQIRGPRVALAGFVGASLAMSGAALQGLFRNPLADPSLVGVSSGAAVGAIAMIIFGPSVAAPSALMPYLIPLSAVGGAATVTLFLYAFARRFGNFSITTMLLVGIALGAMATVAIGAFEYLSDDTQLRTLVFWMMGSFGRATWTAVLPAIGIMAAAMVVLARDARNLDRLQLGEAEAQHLGIDVNGLKRRVVLSAAAAVGAAVAVSGIIAFIGLVVPHLTRLLGGAGNRYVLPAAGLLGASLATFADLVARTAVVPAELPVGLVTSALGAPFFLWLITRVRTT